MTTPTVHELARRVEPTSHDTFIDGLYVIERHSRSTKMPALRVDATRTPAARRRSIDRRAERI